MTELTILDRAEQALAFTETRDKLTELATQSHRIVAITNAAGYQECHAARMTLKSMRIEIEKRGKLAREDSTKFSKAVIAKESELIGLIEPEEKRLTALQDEVDRQKEIEKKAKEEAERQRVAAINARFEAMKSLPLRAVNATVSDIDSIIADAESVDPLTFPEDLQAACVYEKRVVIASLRAAKDRRIAQDAEEVRIQAEREELARLRAETEAMRAAEEARQRREREEAAQRAEEEARAERERLAANERAARAEREAMEQAEREERLRVQAEEDRLRAEKEAALEQERRDLEVERAALAKRKAAEAKAAKDRAIANASLQEAVTEALALLQATQPEHVATLKLAAAVEREGWKVAA
jgi:hypothetical protein